MKIFNALFKSKSEKFPRYKKATRGFTIVEAVVGLAIVSIMSIAMLSLMFSSVNATANAINKLRAQALTESIIECYRVTDNEADFNDALAFAISDESERGVCNILWGESEIVFTVTVGDEVIRYTFGKGGTGE